MCEVLKFVSVLLSASVERVGVSRMRDFSYFFYIIVKNIFGFLYIGNNFEIKAIISLAILIISYGIFIGCEGLFFSAFNIDFCSILKAL